MPHAIWILHGTRVQVLLKGISCSSWGQELPWQCKVSPLMFTKGTVLSQSLGSAAWEASDKKGWQESRFSSFVALVQQVSTQGVCACGRDIPKGHMKVSDVTHTRGVKCCSAVLGKQGYWQRQLMRSGLGPPRCLRSYLLGGEKFERSGISLGTKFKCRHSEPFYNLSVWCLSSFSYHSAQ